MMSVQSSQIPFPITHANALTTTNNETLSSSTTFFVSPGEVPITQHSINHHQDEDISPRDHLPITSNNGPNTTEANDSEQVVSMENEMNDCKKLYDSPSTVFTADWDSDKTSAGNVTPTTSGIFAKSMSPEDAPLNIPQSTDNSNTVGMNYLLPPPGTHYPQVPVLMNDKTLLLPQKKTTTSFQPILYSAIGSLEQYNQENIGSFEKKIFTVGETRALNRKKKGSIRMEDSKTKSATDQKIENATAMMNDTQNAQETKSEQKGPILKKAQIGHSQSTSSFLTSVGARKDQTQQIIEMEHWNAQKGDQKSTSNTGAMKNKVKIVSNKNSEKVRKRPVEMFRPSCDAYTPRMGKKSIEYKPKEQRGHLQNMSAPIGTLQRPNFRDALRRVSMIIRQHVVKIDQRLSSDEGRPKSAGLFSKKMRDVFTEENFLTPRYKCNFVKIPMARAGLVCSMRKINIDYHSPSESEIYEFAHELFKSVRLSSECSIVCLIYIERLMEVAKVPLSSDTWRPIFMCGLLLASKVWQDLSSWNIEFASVYPQYSLESINRLELMFLKMIKWDLYISSSLYAKYYFALRSLLEKKDFRHRYNILVGAAGTVPASQALKIEKRTTIIKEEVLHNFSKSM